MFSMVRGAHRLSSKDSLTRSYSLLTLEAGLHAKWCATKGCHLENLFGAWTAGGWWSRYRPVFLAAWVRLCFAGNVDHRHQDLQCGYCWPMEGTEGCSCEGNCVEIEEHQDSVVERVESQEGEEEGRLRLRTASAGLG